LPLCLLPDQVVVVVVVTPEECRFHSIYGLLEDGAIIVSNRHPDGRGRRLLQIMVVVIVMMVT